MQPVKRPAEQMGPDPKFARLNQTSINSQGGIGEMCASVQVAIGSIAAKVKELEDQNRQTLAEAEKYKKLYEKTEPGLANLVKLAKTARDKKDFVTAKAHYLALSIIYPSELSYKSELACAARRSGDYTLAEKTANEMMAIDPGVSHAHLGALSFVQKKYSQAIEHYNLALSFLKDPTSIERAKLNLEEARAKLAEASKPAVVVSSAPAPAQAPKKDDDFDDLL